MSSPYDQEAIARAFQEVMPRIGTNDPADVMLKYAADKDLPPAVLERMAQTFNTARALHTLKTASTQEARGRNYDLIDTEALLSRYVEWQPPVSTAAKRATSGWFADTEKSAGATFTVEDQVPDYVGTALWGGDRYDRPEPEPEKRAAAVQALPTYHSSRMELGLLAAAASKSAHMIRQRCDTMKAAARQNPNLCGELMQDLVPLVGERAKAACAFLHNYLERSGVRQTPLDKFAALPRPLVVDRHKAASWVQSHFADVDVITGAAHIGAGLVKYAGSDTAEAEKLRDMHEVYSDEEGFDFDAESAEPDGPPPRTRGEEGFPTPEPEVGNSGKDKEDAPTSPSEEAPPLRRPGGGSNPQSAPSPSGGPATKGPSGKSRWDASRLPSATGAYTASIISDQADRKLREQTVRDQAIGDLHAATVLQRILLNDEVLSKANPERVVSHYNTIRRADPTLAADPNLVTIALREAVAYDAVPLHTYDQMLSTRDKARPGDKSDKGVKPPSVNLSLLGL